MRILSRSVWQTCKTWQLDISPTCLDMKGPMRDLGVEPMDDPSGNQAGSQLCQPAGHVKKLHAFNSMHSIHSMHSRAHVRYTSATTTQTLNSVFATLNQHPLWRTMSHHVTPLYPTGSQSKWSLSTRSPLASTGGPSLVRWTCLEPRSCFLFKAAVFFVTLCYASLDHNYFLDNLAYLGPTREICSCIWLESLEWFEAWSSWAHRHCYVRNKLSREEQAVCRSCIGRTGGNWERTWKNTNILLVNIYYNLFGFIKCCRQLSMFREQSVFAHATMSTRSAASPPFVVLKAGALPRMSSVFNKRGQQMPMPWSWSVP